MTSSASKDSQAGLCRAVCSSIQPLRAMLKHQLLNRRCQVLYFNSNAALQMLVQGQASLANFSLPPISQRPYITQVLMVTCPHKKRHLSSVLVSVSGTSVLRSGIDGFKAHYPSLSLVFSRHLSHCLCQVVVFFKWQEKVMKQFSLKPLRSIY